MLIVKITSVFGQSDLPVTELPGIIRIKGNEPQMIAGDQFYIDGQSDSFLTGAPVPCSAKTFDGPDSTELHQKYFELLAREALPRYVPQSSSM